MSLADEARRIRQNMDAEPAESVISVLEQVAQNLKSEHTRKYLAGKLDAARGAQGGEQREQLKKLAPYLDWQASGG